MPKVFAQVSGAVTSPTLAAQFEAFRANFPQARWHQWEATGLPGHIRDDFGDETRLELRHTTPPEPAEFWAEYGPGAVGVGEPHHLDGPVHDLALAHVGGVFCDVAGGSQHVTQLGLALGEQLRESGGMCAIVRIHLEPR